MVKSHIKNELGKMLVDIAVSKINRWAKKQVFTLQNQDKFPLCVPLNKHTWIIGNYRITELGDKRYKVSTDNKTVHIFYNKKAAIFYAVLNNSKYTYRVKIAQELLENDIITGKLYDKMLFYYKKLQVRKPTNAFKHQLWQSRHRDLQLRFRTANKDLLKKLNQAKYIKVWED